jgi:late competence protein required for DNA uptake (superfamily II DNA/RNA helicase)
MCDKCDKEIKGGFWALETGELYCEDCYSEHKKRSKETKLSLSEK